MRILFAVGSYWPHTGGVQVVTQYLAEGLVKKGHEVLVVVKKTEDIENEYTHNGVKIICFKKKNILKYRYGEKERYQNFIIEQSKNLDAIISVSSQNFVTNWLYPIMDKIKCKKILYQHGMEDGRLYFFRYSSMKQKFQHLILTLYWEAYHRYYWKDITKFDACVHLFKNDSSYLYFERKGYKHNYVIMNGCDDAFFENNQDRNNILEKYPINRPFFLFVANFNDNKNQERTVSCFEKSGCKGMNMVLIGSKANSYLDKLKQRINSSDYLKDRVSTLYGIPREDVVALTKLAYACVITSKKEYLPVCVLESMACGVPFIASDSGVLSMIPGGQVCRNNYELAYWLKYFEVHPDYVKELGYIASKYARNNCVLKDKVDELERIIAENRGGI